MCVSDLACIQEGHGFSPTNEEVHLERKSVGFIVGSGVTPWDTKTQNGKSITDWLILWKHKPAEEVTRDEKIMIKGQNPSRLFSQVQNRKEKNSVFVTKRENVYQWEGGIMLRSGQFVFVTLALGHGNLSIAGSLGSAFHYFSLPVN
ncbi:hypothetical protein VNO77_38862 [Canavalia gladiata]|uniref:Uncharacterized protein n=1 Tax=Canavalia gladiata TaxID=3824 RepID=A0AAN9KCJ7_CANGL